MKGRVETGKILLYHAVCDDRDFPTGAGTNVPSDRFEDQILVLGLKDHLPYILNHVASYVFVRINGRKDERVMAGEVCRAYDVPFDKALEDMRALFREFVQKGIAEIVRSAV